MEHNLPRQIPSVTPSKSRYGQSSTSPSSTETPTSMPCQAKITNPRAGDRFRPGDTMNVTWSLIGNECATDGVVPKH
ncbi:9913_t:CDS:1, partial [Acaulospora morrowiae]